MGHPVDADFHIAPLASSPPPRTLVSGVGEQLEAGDRADTGQGLAAKSQGGHRFQVFQTPDFAGGVTTESQRQVVGVDTGAVIAHPDTLGTAVVHVDIDTVGAGIETVFQQFLDHRGGTLHHLAGGDLVGESGA